MAAPSNAADMIGQVLLQGLQAAEEKVDEQLAQLDNMTEDDYETIRQKRLAQLKAQHQKKQQWLANGHGQYREVTDQKQFFEELKRSERAVVHFYRPSTWRCEIVDKHLGTLAPKHIETKFIKINAEKSPFICEKLNIYMLPTIVLVKDGKTDHSIIGFDELGGDDFATETLESVLLQYECVLESFC